MVIGEYRSSSFSLRGWVDKLLGTQQLLLQCEKLLLVPSVFLQNIQHT